MFRDIVRKTRDDARLSEVFAEPLSLAFRVRHQRQNQRGRKVYSLHAPEVECIGKGKAHRSYEFGVKVSVATTLAHSKGGHGDVANAMLAAARLQLPTAAGLARRPLACLHHGAARRRLGR